METYADTPALAGDLGVDVGGEAACLGGRGETVLDELPHEIAGRGAVLSCELKLGSEKKKVNRAGAGAGERRVKLVVPRPMTYCTRTLVEKPWTDMSLSETQSLSCLSLAITGGSKFLEKNQWSETLSTGVGREGDGDEKRRRA